jgi:hypothetical protein
LRLSLFSVTSFGSDGAGGGAGTGARDGGDFEIRVVVVWTYRNYKREELGYGCRIRASAPVRGGEEEESG